jgi:hypothetical protein
MTQVQFDNIIRKRTTQHTRESFQYFWASFVMQIIVYALLSHVLIKNFGNGMIMIPAAAGILLYIPFTIMIMNKFKTMAISKSDSISAHVQKQYQLLESFYKFKRRYELILIPLISLIGTFITFQLFVPGFYLKAEIIVFFITLASCIIAIRAENKKSFDIPLSKLRLILEDLNA